MKPTNPVPPGYKRTKVGVIPEEWEVVKIEDVIERSFYGTSKSTSQKGKYPVLRMGNMRNGTIDYENLAYIDLEKKDFEQISLKPGDILLNRTNSYDLVGKVSLFDKEEDFITASYIVTYRPKQSVIDSNFLNNLLNTSYYQGKIKALATKGVSQANINPTVFKKVIKIPLPPLKEQQKIAQILSTWDEAIAKLEALIEEKERFKKGLMHKLLSAELRFPGFEGEWKEVRLGDVAIRITKKNVDNSIKLVFSNSATDGIVMQNDYFDKDIANKNNLLGYYIVEPGDFVYNPRISKSAPAGPISRNNKDTSGIVSPLYTVFRFKTSKFATFIEYYFRSMLWIRFMNSIANYGARHDRMNITIRDFMKMPLPFPSEAEQEKIVEILDTVDKELMLLKKELEALKEQKRGLMQKLLSGEVRVKL